MPNNTVLIHQLLTKKLQTTKLLNRIAAGFLLLTLLGCTPKRNISKVKIEEPVTSDIDILNKQLQDHAPSYKWLVTQGELNYNDGLNDNTVNLSMRNRRDSLIWASGNLLIEAVRILINKDSAIILNRLQKNYTVYPISDLNKLLAMNDLNLHAVQNLLQGLPPFGINQKSKLDLKEKIYHIVNQQATYREEILIPADILRMTQYRYERNTTEYVLVNYSDFRAVGNQVLPNKIEMEVHTPDKIHIILNVSDYSLEQNDDAPFYIPANYTKVK
jgi:hypothetical protein